ncbi:hypothetical protein GCM10027070_12170 [Barrientosiimonas humi]
MSASSDWEGSSGAGMLTRTVLADRVACSMRRPNVAPSTTVPGVGAAAEALVAAAGAVVVAAGAAGLAARAVLDVAALGVAAEVAASSPPDWQPVSTVAPSSAATPHTGRRKR